MERICLNCAHMGRYVSEVNGKAHHMCNVNADVLHANTQLIVSNLGGCEDSFEPSEDYLAEMEKTKAFQRDPAGHYGVIAGIDFPTTLNLNIWKV